ncbi:MAG TPA: cytidylate kinase-like family protein [Terriglobales bacterium]|nr:cytidylate kinase-like family protein [Terriglobales bacterium]
MFRIITIEREYGCGGGTIARKLAERLGWRLWDQSLTEEIAKLANVDCSAVERKGEKLDSAFYRLAKVFWRGSYERAIPLDVTQTFDADCMVSMMEKIAARITQEGNAVVVGRGAPYILRNRKDAFHVFLYAPHEEKMRRIVADGISEQEAEELIESVDRDRSAFIRHYFNADWPTRSLYHLMMNTALGDEQVIATILDTMRRVEENPDLKPRLRGVR